MISFHFDGFVVDINPVFVFCDINQMDLSTTEAFLKKWSDSSDLEKLIFLLVAFSRPSNFDTDQNNSKMKSAFTATECERGNQYPWGYSPPNAPPWYSPRYNVQYSGPSHHRPPPRMPYYLRPSWGSGPPPPPPPRSGPPWVNQSHTSVARSSVRENIKAAKTDGENSKSSKITAQSKTTVSNMDIKTQPVSAKSNSCSSNLIYLTNNEDPVQCSSENKGSSDLVNETRNHSKDVSPESGKEAHSSTNNTLNKTCLPKTSGSFSKNGINVECKDVEKKSLEKSIQNRDKEKLFNNVKEGVTQKISDKKGFQNNSNNVDIVISNNKVNGNIHSSKNNTLKTKVCEDTNATEGDTVEVLQASIRQIDNNLKEKKNKTE